MEEIYELITSQTFGVWFLIGAALVFWMQAGFAMVEAGFTRAKNTGNIIMKNLMDFCIGTVMWFLLGSSLMLGSSIGGFIGGFNFDVLTHFADFDYFRFPEVYRSIRREEITEFIRRVVRQERCAVSVIYPVEHPDESNFTS